MWKLGPKLKIDIAAEHNSVVPGIFVKLNYLETNDVLIFCSFNNKVSEINLRDTDEFSRVLYWFLVRYFHLDHYAPDLKAAPMTWAREVSILAHSHYIETGQDSW